MLIFLSALSALGSNLVQFGLYIGAGLLVFRVAAQPNLPACFAIFFFVMIVATALGIFAAAIQVALQKGSAAVWLLGSALWFVTGTLFPVSSLPIPLQKIAALVPVTALIDGMRQGLLEGANLHQLMPKLMTMALLSCLLLPLSLWTFSWTLRRARTLGTLSFY